MIREKTVFVIGAGAGVPYGFPTGLKLRDNIIKTLSPSGSISKLFLPDKALRSGEQEIKHKFLEDCAGFASKFNGANISLIDRFLSINRDDNNLLKIGKMAIVYEILRAERDCSVNMGILAIYDWFFYLYDNMMTNTITDKRDLVKFLENDVCFITFNYDRFLEHYLYSSLANTFTLTDPVEITKLLSKIEIIHVYGKIGPLEWQDNTHGIKFGNDQQEITLDLLESTYKNINIVYDERTSEDHRELIYKKLKETNHLIFLGFGWDQMNLELLGIPDILKSTQLILGTSYKLEDGQIRRTYNILKQATQRQPISVRIGDINCDCLNLLKHGPLIKNRFS